MVVLVGVRGDMAARCWGHRVGCLLKYWYDSVCSNKDWQGLCRRFMACRGFRGYWGADEGRWVLGWIRELRMGKRERDAERTCEKSDAKIWLAVVKARSWWSKLDKMALTEEARDAGDPMLAVV